MEIYNYFITLNQLADSHHIHYKHTKTDYLGKQSSVLN